MNFIQFEPNLKLNGVPSHLSLIIKVSIRHKGRAVNLDGTKSR